MAAVDLVPYNPPNVNSFPWSFPYSFLTAAQLGVLARFTGQEPPCPIHGGG